MSQQNSDYVANPFQQSKVIKKISIYNRLADKIKIIAKVEKQRNVIKNIDIERDQIERKIEDNENKNDYVKTQNSLNNKQNIHKNDNLRHTTQSTTIQNNSQVNNTAKNMTENEASSAWNAKAGGSYGGSNSNSQSKSDYNRAKKGGGGGVSYAGFGANAHYQQEDETKNDNSSHIQSARNISGSISGGQQSSTKNKKIDKSSNSNKQKATNIHKHEEKEEHKSMNENKDGIELSLNETDSSANKHRKDHKITATLKAKVNYNLDTPIDQQTECVVVIEATSMQEIQMTVNDQNSLIYLTIYIYISENGACARGKWIEYCKNKGTDNGEFALDKNNINGKPNFYALNKDITRKINQKNNVELITNWNKEEIAAENKNVMINDWDEEDVCDYIKYLSRIHGTHIIDPNIADRMETEEIDGERLYNMNKKELKSIIKDMNNYKIATKNIWVELRKVKKGDLRIPLTEELDYKIINGWDGQMVKMYIGTIYNGKYYQYADSFKYTSGKNLLEMRETTLKTDYNIYDAMIQLEIWEKIQEIAQNKNVPTKTDIVRNYQTIAKQNESSSVQQLREWFEGTLKLPQYFDIFVENGYENVSQFDETMTEDNMIDIGINNRVHRKKILSQIKQLLMQKIAQQKQKRKRKFGRGYQLVKQIKEMDPNKRHRTMMMVGATGTGKSSLINSMMNYLYEVEIDDEHRFKLFIENKKAGGQAMSQTDDVTPYYLDPPALDYQLTIVDTPGYGDTRGVEQDAKITEKVKECFEKVVLDIDAVCFVIQAGQSRLTPTQKYVFNKILGVFGNDIKENIFVLITFADPTKPPALAALEQDRVPYKQYFKLNNSVFALNKNAYGHYGDIDEKDDENYIDPEYKSVVWKMGMKTFEEFFIELDKVETKSLALSKDVLREREELQNYVDSIKPTIDVGLMGIRALKESLIWVKANGDIGINVFAQDPFRFYGEYSALKTRTINISTHSANPTSVCLECKWTCHKKCHYTANKDKGKCIAMKNGRCTICPGNCVPEKHKNTEYYFEWYINPSKPCGRDFVLQYCNGESKESRLKQVINGLERDIKTKEKNLNVVVNSVRKCVNRLSKIALRPNVLEPTGYIDMLIIEAKEEKRPGWQEKIESLIKLKEQHELIQKIHKNSFDPLRKDINEANEIINEEQKKSWCVLL